jgi:hypothetical protein
MIKKVNHPRFGECVELAGDGWRAVVSPDMGFALVDYSVKEVQILDLKRTPNFIDNRKGLGPLILPHFNQEGPIPAAVDAKKFPHAAKLKEININHPFQHGVGRYMPWTVTTGENYVEGKISGADKFNGYSLKEIAGFDFSATVRYVAGPYQLLVTFDVTGDKPVFAGIHFYYDLVNAATATVTLPVEGQKDALVVKLDQALDNVYLPPRTKDVAKCRLETDTYRLDTFIKTAGAPEESFDAVTIFSPKDATFVCVEPLSAVPGKPNPKTRFSAAIGLVPSKK